MLKSRGIFGKKRSALFGAGSAPTVISATNVGTSGGSASVVGSAFVSGCVASVNIGGTVTPLTVTFVDSAHLVVALASGTYAAGTWDLTVANPDGQSDTETVFVITAVLNPMTIFGAHLRAQYIAGQATVLGGAVSSVPDNTGNGNTISQATAGQRPTYNAADATYNGLPSIKHTAASSQHLTGTGFGLGSAGNIYVYAGFQAPATSSTSQFLATYGAGVYGMFASSATCVPFTGIGTPLSWTASLGGGAAIAVAGFDGSGSATHIAIDNETTLNGSQGSVAPISGQTLEIGSDNGTSAFWDGTWCELGILDALPTNTQAVQLQQYMNLTYNISPPITFTAATNVGTAGGGIRITGGGFLPGLTLSGSAGMGAITVTKVTATLIEATIPAASAAQYDLNIINPDGQQLTVSNGINVTTVADPMTIFGLLCQAWYEDQVTLSGSSVVAWLDKSLLGRDYLQATGANQLTYTASDPNFNHHPSLTGNGTTGQMVGINWYGATYGVSFAAGLTVLSVVRRNSGTGTVFYFNMGNSPWLNFPTTAPQFQAQGGTSALVTWGSAISGAQNIVCIAPSGAGTLSVDVANGTPVATSASGVSLAVTGGLDLFNAAGGSQFNGSIAAQVVLNGVPTSGQLAAWETYAQGLGAA